MTALSGKHFASRRDWVAAILITVAIFILHGYFWLHAGGLWRDEVNVINLAGSHSLAYMAQDSFPVLMPLVLHGWAGLGLGGSDLKLRLMGSLIGQGTAAALWLATWAARRTPPLMSLILFGLNSTVIFWGDSLRAFGLGALLIVLALAAMCFLLEKPTWRRTGILTFAAVLSVQALYQNSVLFASIGVGGWLVCWRRKDKSAALKILAAGLTAFVSLLPYWSCIVKWSASAAVIRPGFSFIAAAGNFDTVAGFPLPQYVWVWKLLSLVVLAQGILIFFRPSQQSDMPGRRLTPAEMQVFAAATLLASLAGYFCFLYFAALITEPWYFLPLLALLAVCIDLGISVNTLPNWLRAAVFGILLATAGIAVPFATRDLNCRFTNIDLVAKYLAEKISPQDYVVVTPWYLGISFDRYYRGAAVWDTLPPVADHSTHRFDLAQTATADSQASQLVLDRIAHTLQAGHRVWIVGWMHIPAAGRPAATEVGQFIVNHSQSFETLDLKNKIPISDFEEASLLLATGWQTNSP